FAAVRRGEAGSFRRRARCPAGIRSVERRVPAGDQEAARRLFRSHVRAVVRQRRHACREGLAARAQGHHSSAICASRRARRAPADHRSFPGRSVLCGGDDAVADRAERSHVLKLALPALLVAAFILASTPAAEAHNTWNGGYRKWPWRGSDDRTLTTLPGECPHCPGVETSSASKAIDVAMNYETVYSIAPGTISIYSTSGGNAGIYLQVTDVDGEHITRDHIIEAIGESCSVVSW